MPSPVFYQYDDYSPWTYNLQFEQNDAVDADQQACLNFGKSVRRLRTKQNLSQESLADKAAIDRSYMGGIERGERNPTLAMIRRIAKALRVDPAKLL